MSACLEERHDIEIACDCGHALENCVMVPRGLTVTLDHGHAMLGGVVHWPHQKMVAESAIRYIRGVTSVANEIRVVAP